MRCLFHRICNPHENIVAARGSFWAFSIVKRQLDEENVSNGNKGEPPSLAEDGDRVSLRNFVLRVSLFLFPVARKYSELISAMLWLKSSTSGTEVSLLLDKFHEAKTTKIETNKWQSKLLLSLYSFSFHFCVMGFRLSEIILNLALEAGIVQSV
jgi:hypothetical protein